MNPQLTGAPQETSEQNDGKLAKAIQCLQTHTAACAFALSVAVGVTPAHADVRSDEVLAALSASQNGESIQLASLSPGDITSYFMGGIRQGFGENITPEIEETISTLEVNYKNFVEALSAELEGVQGLLERQEALDEAVNPNILKLASTFSEADQPTQIRIVQNYANGANVSDSISQEFAYLGESREGLERFYFEGMMKEFERLARRANRPDQLDPSIQVSEDEYLERLRGTAQIGGLYNAYVSYLLDQEVDGYTPKMSEEQFYGILALAQESFENGEWGRDDERRHIGKTRIALEGLLTQEYSDFSGRMGDFFKTIGYEQAAQIHPEIRIAYNADQRADAAEAQADAAEAQADAAEAQADAAEAQADADIAAAEARADLQDRIYNALTGSGS